MCGEKCASDQRISEYPFKIHFQFSMSTGIVLIMNKKSYRVCDQDPIITDC